MKSVLQNIGGRAFETGPDDRGPDLPQQWKVSEGFWLTIIWSRNWAVLLPSTKRPALCLIAATIADMDVLISWATAVNKVKQILSRIESGDPIAAEQLHLSAIGVIAALLFALAVAFPNAAHADIFQWEYINPADPSQGKKQSATLAPDGAGLIATPSLQAAYKNLTMAYLTGADVHGALYGCQFDQCRFE